MDGCNSPFNKIENSIGRPINDFVTGYVGSPTETAWNSVLEIQKTSYIKELKFEEDERRTTYWDATKTPIFENGKMRYIFEITTDVTERVHDKQHIQQ